MTVIPLPFVRPPLTQNGLRRMHFHQEAREKADAKGRIIVAIRKARVAPRVGANVVLHYRVATRRRLDADGLAPTLKVALDALVAAGVLTDDSFVEVPFSGVRIHPPEPGMAAALWLELTPVEETA